MPRRVTGWKLVEVVSSLILRTLRGSLLVLPAFVGSETLRTGERIRGDRRAAAGMGILEPHLPSCPPASLAVVCSVLGVKRSSPRELFSRNLERSVERPSGEAGEEVNGGIEREVYSR